MKAPRGTFYLVKVGWGGGGGGLAESMGAHEGPRAGEGPGLGKKAGLDGEDFGCPAGTSSLCRNTFFGCYLFIF